MSGTSKKSTVVTFRLPNRLYKILERRFNKQYRYPTLSGYIINRLEYDLTRKHGGRK